MAIMDGGGSKRTLIEEGSEFRGSIRSSCPIVVNGRIEGDVETPSLSVSATGAVHGRATVGEVRSEGELAGEFDADKVSLSGTVKDNTIIRAKSLDVKLSSGDNKMQVVFGEVELAVGEAPVDDPEAQKRGGRRRQESPPPGETDEAS